MTVCFGCAIPCVHKIYEVANSIEDKFIFVCFSTSIHRKKQLHKQHQNDNINLLIK